MEYLLFIINHLIITHHSCKGKNNKPMKYQATGSFNHIKGGGSDPNSGWGPRPFGATVAATPISPPKIGFFQKSIKLIISHQQSIDNSLLSYQKKFQPDWTKNSQVMAKRRMPIYGIINNLAKYQHFSMRPGLFDKYHWITYSLQFVA